MICTNDSDIKKLFARYKGDTRQDALFVLTHELKIFSDYALLLLSNHLKKKRVGRGTWESCALSYAEGSPGSRRRDRLGNGRNCFTVYWDDGLMDESDVLDAVNRELMARGVP